MKCLYLLTLSTAMLCGACQSSDQYLGTVESKALEKEVISTDHLAFIYDFNASQDGLDLKAVEVPSPTGDEVWDLLIAFLSQCSIPHSLDQLELVGVKSAHEALQITFRSPSIPGNRWSESLFFTALNMTLTRKLGNQSFEIRINDEPLLLSASGNISDNKS